MLLDTIICSDLRALNGEDHELTSHNARKTLNSSFCKYLQAHGTLESIPHASQVQSQSRALKNSQNQDFFPSMGKPNFARVKGLN